MTPEELLKYKRKIEATGTSFLQVDPEENNDEYRHFYFVGQYEGKETIFDAIVYTLRLQHETEIYELAEKEAARNFPEYNDLKNISEELEKEIGMFMAETIVAMEEEGEVTVSEHVDLDTEVDFGIGFEAGLRVEKITDRVIENLIEQFNTDSLVLDETLVSYQNGGEEGS
jgi:hypothetical protein